MSNFRFIDFSFCSKVLEFLYVAFSLVQEHCAVFYCWFMFSFHKKWGQNIKSMLYFHVQRKKERKNKGAELFWKFGKLDWYCKCSSKYHTMPFFPGGYQAPGNPGGYPPPQPQSYPQPYPQPQPYQSPPGPQPSTTTTVITQPVGAVIVNMHFGESPVSMVCPHCQTHIITCTTYQDGTLTWLAAGALCLLG